MRTTGAIVWGTAFATVTAAACLSLTTPAAAQDDDLALVACTLPSSETSDFSPALTSSPQTSTVTVNTHYSGCLAPTELTLTSGSRSGTFPRDTSCLDLLGGGTRTFTITWDNGKTSTITGQTVANVVGAVLTSTLTGTVTSGLFEGGLVVQQVISPAADITLCTLGLGTVSHLDSAVLLSITDL
ncbi:hypothetical protein [Streptomyces sp. NPDC003730]